MPRFSVAFSRRKSAATAEDFQNAQIATTEQSSFRVIERSELPGGKSFDGGARLARASGASLPRPNTMVDLSMDDNMFADVKGNRGSGASNTTKATSTDTSSRHSNASTAPSSADLGANAHEEQRNARKPLQDVASRAAPKTSPSSFLKNATRTFSFGGQKKHTVPPPANNEPLPDVPSVPTIHQEDPYGRSRGMTTSTTSTATPPKLEGSNLDMGGDFGSMFSGFDKRASMATLKNVLSSPTPSKPNGVGEPRSITANRPFQPAPLNLDSTTAVEPPPKSWNSQNSNDVLLESKIPSPINDRPPPVPHYVSQPPRSPSAPLDVIEDEDALLLKQTVAAGNLLSANTSSRRAEPVRYVLEERSGKNEENMFDGSAPRIPISTYRPAAKAAGPPQSKVMTTEQFEKYRKDKERYTSSAQDNKGQAEDDDGDDINYDDDEDEAEKSKQQVRQRKKQEAHMSVYRQQMMKVTGEPAPDNLTPSYRPGLSTSMSAPHLSLLKAPSPDHTTGISDEEEDDEVPLAILQAHGFPNKNRPPTRLSGMGSNPNLRASMMPPSSGRPGSAMGESSSQATQRHSTLPAFARNLPQDPFVGASLAKPAVRESLSFGGGTPVGSMPQQAPVLPPGGLVGVIANEERSRAMRRGSPNIDNQKLMGTGVSGAQGFDPVGGIPHQMMYAMGQQAPMGATPGMAGMPMMPGMPMMSGMPMMPQPTLTPGDQAQIQMTQQMQQFMQMQMQFMQMMAMNQNGQAQMAQQPYGNLGGSPSMVDLPSRNSMVGEQLSEPRRMDAGMRTMSMVQPSSASFMQQPGYAGSIRGGPAPGYTPSIAPSERSNVGLPSRYRPVSQAPGAALSAASPPTIQHQRASTMSGALSLAQWDDAKRKSTMNVVTKAGDASDDEEEGWENMKAKREKKRSLWKSKKSFGSDISAMLK